MPEPVAVDRRELCTERGLRASWCWLLMTSAWARLLCPGDR